MLSVLHQHQEARQSSVAQQCSKNTRQLGGLRPRWERRTLGDARRVLTRQQVDSGGVAKTARIRSNCC